MLNSGNLTRRHARLDPREHEYCSERTSHLGNLERKSLSKTKTNIAFLNCIKLYEFKWKEICLLDVWQIGNDGGPEVFCQGRLPLQHETEQLGSMSRQKAYDASFTKGRCEAQVQGTNIFKFVCIYQAVKNLRRAYKWYNQNKTIYENV